MYDKGDSRMIFNLFVSIIGNVLKDTLFLSKKMHVFSFIFIAFLLLFCPGEAGAKTKIESIYCVVNDDVITETDFKIFYDYMRQAAVQSGRSLPGEREVLSNMISSLLIKQEAKRKGSMITPIDVTNQIRRFASMNGLRSIDQLKQVLPSQGMSWDIFYTMQENQLYMQELMGQMVSGVDPTINDIKDYYEKHKDDFFSIKEDQAVYKLARIQFIPQGENNFSEYREKRRDAEKVYEKLNEGESFEKMVRQYSEDASTKPTDGILGWMLPDELGYRTLTVVENLGSNEISEIFTDQNNAISIYKVIDKKTSGYIPFEKAKLLIKNRMLMEQREEALNRKIKNIKEESYIVEKHAFDS